MKNSVPIYILGLYDTGLYIAHATIQNNIPVFGFDYNIKNPGFYSRYIKASICAHPFYEPEKLFGQLIGHSEKTATKPILIPSSEEFIEFMLQYEDRLKERFLFIQPQKATLEKLLNKAFQNELAQMCDLNIAPFWSIRNYTDFENLVNQKEDGRLILKALNQSEWKTKVPQKAYITHNLEELKTIGKSLLENQISFIAQEIIEGPCTNNFEYNALVINGAIVKQSVIQKIRQYPPAYGAASCIQTCNNIIIEELGKKFVLFHKLEGFSNTEFKLNPYDGQYYYIESNARVWMQIRLTESLGINFIMQYYNCLTKYPLSIVRKSFSGSDNIKWVDIFSDTLLWWRYLRKEGQGLLSYMKSLSKVKYYGLFNVKDLRPFIHTITEMKIFNLFLRSKS